MIRAILGAIIGAAAAAAALLLFTLSGPAITLETDTDVPRSVASGFFPAEYHEADTFVWTRPLATVTFRGVDRRVEWTCAVRLRGPRPPGQPPASVSVGIDGATEAPAAAGYEYHDVEVTAPAGRATTLSLSISTSPPFVPPADRRELGVQVNRIVCRPATAWVLPSRPALLAIAVAGAAFGASFGLLAPLLGALVCSMAFGVALAWMFQVGVAAYTRSYLEWIVPLALWTAGPVTAVGVLARTRMSPTARWVVAFLGAVVFLKLAALLHPSKPLIDAVFQAHRLEWVLAGRYFFTQPMPGGVQFPYAIGLYVFAIPFTTLVRDYVTLLRMVVIVIEAAASAMLYLVVARVWKDRTAAASAVVIAHLAPLPYAVIGNANLTYAFGQGISVIAVGLAILLAGSRKSLPLIALFFGVAALAFLSHVGVFPLLAVTLCALAVLYWTSGGTTFRPAAPVVLLATVAAAVLAVGAYYAHFPEVYRTLDRVSSGKSDTPPANPSPTAEPGAAPAQPATSAPGRAVRAIALARRDLGLPILALLVGGIWLTARSQRDELTLALSAWGIACGLFVVFRILAPVDPRLQRYADEFIDRVYYATLPAFAILAGRAFSAGWHAGTGFRIVVVLLGAAATATGLAAWTSWLVRPS